MKAQSTKFSRGVEDVCSGILSLHLWPLLAWQEIRQRYQRSVIGPFWLTLSTAIFIAGMGPLFGLLMNQNTSEFTHFVAVSFVIWLYISSLINEGCTTFIAAEGFVKQTRLPLTVHALRVVWRNTIILAHNFVIVIFVSAFFAPTWGVGILTVPLGLALIAVNGVWVALLLGLLSARFRDIPQIVASAVQLLFFLTPIFWRPEMLAKKQWVADWNPAFHFLELVRAPLLGQPVPGFSWIVAVALTVTGWFITALFFFRYRSRIAYWM